MFSAFAPKNQCAMPENPEDFSSCVVGTAFGIPYNGERDARSCPVRGVATGNKSNDDFEISGN
jgi:hypothetical protein